MDAIKRFFRKVSLLFNRDRFRAELDEEMAFHRTQTEREYEAHGMSSEAARLASLRRFGNVTHLKERSHEQVRFRFEQVLQDVRFALRQLRKNPGFAATAIGVLALGIGASVALFAFVDAALIKPLPFAGPNQLMSVYETVPSCLLCNVSYQNFLDWRRESHSFAALEAWGYARYTLHEQGSTEMADGARVSDGFFRALGVKPMLGRDFYAGEDRPGSPRTALISYAAWQKRFGGTSDIIGKTTQLDDLPYTVIGVLPQNFHFAVRGESDFWTALNDPDGCQKRRGCHSLFGIARLKEGVSVAAASAEMTAIAAQLEKQYPDSNRGFGAVVRPLSEAVIGQVRPVLLVLLSGAGLLLLIACVNVVSLLLVRSEGRRQEIALREALGASTSRLMGQFVIEGLVLVMAGSIAGLGSALVGIRLLLSLIPPERLEAMPYLEGLGLNARVLAFTAAIAILAAIFFAVAPAFRLKKRDLRGDLAEGSRGAGGRAWKRLGSRLVTVELATAVVLLVGAGLFGKSLYRLLHVDIGFEPERLASVVVSIPKNYTTDARVMALQRALVARVEALPKVKSASIASSTPVRDWDGGVNVAAAGRPLPKERVDVPERDVSAEYLPTLGARLLRGRYFTEAENDPAKPRVVVINETMAKQFFPGEDAVGKELQYVQSKEKVQVIGVIADVKEGQLDTPNRGAMYVPFNQDSWGSFNLVVRTASREQVKDTAALLLTITRAVHEVDKEIPVAGGMSISEMIRTSNAAYLRRTSAWLVGGFAVLALILSVVGLYGVIAYSVAQRTREIGVRMALGASRQSVHTLVLKEAGLLIAIGIALGLISSVTAATLMRKLLFGTAVWDVSTLAGVAALLGAAALVASYIPARRAAGVNPIEALRAE